MSRTTLEKFTLRKKKSQRAPIEELPWPSSVMQASRCATPGSAVFYLEVKVPQEDGEPTPSLAVWWWLRSTAEGLLAYTCSSGLAHKGTRTILQLLSCSATSSHRGLFQVQCDLCAAHDCRMMWKHLQYVLYQHFTACQQIMRTYTTLQLNKTTKSY